MSEILKKPETVKGPAEWFTGDVWFDVIAPPGGPQQGRCNSVRFAPALRTAWHRHANGPSGECGARHRGARCGGEVEVGTHVRLEAAVGVHVDPEQRYQSPPVGIGGRRRWPARSPAPVRPRRP
jgi:hypothetical protein